MSQTRQFYDIALGILTETVKSVDVGVASELEYKDELGNVVGYWAYGYYDPSLPYQG